MTFEPQPGRKRRRTYALMLMTALLMVHQLGFFITIGRQHVSDTMEGWQVVSMGGALVWMFLFMWAVAALWRQRHTENRIHQWVLMLIIVFAIYNGLRLTLFAQAAYDRQRLPFIWVVTISIVLLLILIRQTWTESMETKEKNDDSKSKDRGTA